MSEDYIAMNENLLYNNIQPSTVYEEVANSSDVKTSCKAKEKNYGVKKLACAFVILVAIMIAIAAGLIVCSTLFFTQMLSLKSAIESNVSASLTDLKDSQTEMYLSLASINQSFHYHSITMANSLLFSSCVDVLVLSSFSPSGYYWVRASNGSAVRVYCDLTLSFSSTGGQTRVAYLQFENGSDPCPNGFRTRRDSGIRTCGIRSSTAACPSILFDTYGIPYSRVYGMVRAYQFGTPDAFVGLTNQLNSILRGGVDSNYVDGVSLTHGSNPRQHIWTFAAAVDEYGDNPYTICRCSYHNSTKGLQPPSFVGQDYFCDSGIHGMYRRSDFSFHDSPLWDGAGCGPASTCCSFNNPPWFHKQLPQPTTDNIEMRVCSDEDRANEDILIAQVEIYVQ